MYPRHFSSLVFALGNTPAVHRVAAIRWVIAIVLVICLAQSGSVLAQAPAPQTGLGGTPVVGIADLLYGNVTRLSLAKPGEPQGQAQPLKKDAQLFQGDTIETDDNGYVYIVTVDQAFISIRPKSRLTIESYHISSGNINQTAIRFTLHRGVARFVSGQAISAAKNRFRLNTPVAAIGVRGTDFTVFTTDVVTRASVLSGRIALSPFNESCLPAGLGTCHGSSSLDLAAGGVPVIELTRGDQMPKLLRSEELAPDRLVPPRPDEQPAQKTSTKATRSNPEPASSGVYQAAQTTPETSVLAEIKADDRLGNPVGPSSSVIDWGRWKAIADIPADDLDYADLVDAQVAAILGPYVLNVSNTALLKLPQTGKVGFVLQEFEAFLVKPDGTARALSVQDTELLVDFSRNRFSTRLNLMGSEHGAVVFQSSGGITSRGRLMNDQAEQPTQLLRGVIAGPEGSQAGYLFEQHLSNGLGNISGATRWAR